jgi:hypothetical protein
MVSFLQMLHMFQAYRGDHKGANFKFLHVFLRIETCEKWKKTRLTLAKTKDDVYKPDSRCPGVRGQARAIQGWRKVMGPPGERLQASIDACIADARAHGEQRQVKADERWKLHFQKNDVKIELLKSTATATKKNTNLQFLLGENTANLDDLVKTWYMA